MSCRPAVAQSTARSYVVRRLDDADHKLTLQKKARGQECLDKVCKSLGLFEKEYFGLSYQDKSGDWLWVNLRNPLSEQLPQGNHVVMEMRVKYFISPHKILQPVTRYQFYQQTKRDLLQGRLLVDTAIRAARIGGLMAQVDHGDYKPGLQYSQAGSVTVQGPSDNLEARLKREHQKLAGVSTEIAIEKFLSEVAGLPLYGVEMYSVSGGQYLGVGPEYITTYSSQKTAIKQYSYSSVKYTAFQGKRFKALITLGSRRSEELEVELSSRAVAQALYRSVTEFHTFFRRDTVSSVVKTAGYCKSLLGNIKSQTADRFYFDVTRTHREVVNHVWSLLNPSDQSSTTTRGRPAASPRLRRGRSQHDPLPPIPGISGTPSGSRLQRAASMQQPVRPNVCYQQMPPLPTFQQASHSADGVVINNRPHLASGPSHLTSLASMPSYTASQTISESSDDACSTLSSEYTTMSSRLGPGYAPHSGSLTSSQTLSRRSRESVGSASMAHSPPPDYSEVDPDRQPTPLTFTPHAAGLPLASPSSATLPLSGESVFSFDATSVLTRTRELEGELQRLRSAMTCRLCKQNPIGATFCPCGHTVCCFSCAQRLRTCWECDVLVHSVQRMLLASNV